MKLKYLLFFSIILSSLLLAGNTSAAEKSYFETLFGENSFFGSFFQTAKAEETAVLGVEQVNWSGGSVINSNWTANSNWAGGSVPQFGDTIVFPQNAARKTNVNDFIAGTVFDSIHIAGNNYSITGNQVNLRREILAGIPETSGNNSSTFSPNIVLIPSPNSLKLIHTNLGVLNLNGTFNLNEHNLTLDGNGTLIFNNTIIGGASDRINKNGSGTVIINGNATAVSGISLNSGAVQASGTLGSIDLLGGTLRGGGTVGIIRGDLVAADGAIAPGNGGTATATLTSTGNVDLSSVIDYEVNLNGTTVSSQYDRIVSNGGDISLFNTNLVVALGFTPTAGQTFTIAQTTGAGNNIFGQFAQNNEIVVDGQIFSITYESQRVFLTAQGALPTSLTWDGGGATSFWSEAANWNPNFVPRDGMDLIFPAGAARKTNTNDITGLDVDTISINHFGYDISGNIINLHNGFTSNSASGGSQFRVPINLFSQDQTFSSTGSTSITFGAINLNGHGLTIDNNSFFTFNDVISASGGITKQGASVANFNAHNTYLGITQINNGTLEINHRFGLGSVGNGNQTVVNANAALRIGNNTTSISEAVTLNGGGLNGHQCATGCSMEGAITLNGNNTISVSFADETLSLHGLITGTGGFTKNFNGNLNLTANNNYTGNTIVDGGKLFVNGSQPNNPVSLNGGLLGGGGAMQSVSTNTVGGIISPGDNNTDDLSALNFNLSPNITFHVDIRGTASPGTPPVDRLGTPNGGSINIGGAQLTGNIITQPTAGQQFTILNSPQITGQFAQGNSVFIGGRRFSITYNTTSVVLTAQAGGKAPVDFDGDGKTDISIFRPAPGEWWYQRSSNGTVPAFQFGQSTDKIVPGDFTGDGKTDVAFFRQTTGQWFVLRSEDNSFFAFPFGANGDTPAPADYDGDGKTDAAVFRPSSATWFISRSSDGGTTIQQFGSTGDKPVPADFDGDGKTDIAIWRPGAGEWWYQKSSNGQTTGLQFGVSTDKPVPGDFTGDGKADIALFRPSNGNWFVLRSEDLSFFSFPFGANGDIPVAGDYDGDGRFDAGVFRPSGATWFVNRSNGSGTLIVGFGANGDLPIPAAFIP